MERLFTEAQWRSIADVEFETAVRRQYDAFHAWCLRKRILGGVFSGGEFYIGQSDLGESEFRVFERWSGLDFSSGDDKASVIAAARDRITLIDWYLPVLLDFWKGVHSEKVAEWEQKRVEHEAHAAIRRAKAESKDAKKMYVGKRRREIFAAADGKCHYCKTELVLTGDWEVDHKMPKILGGSNERINLVAACAPCNRTKKDKTDVEFFALLASRASGG